MLLACLAVGLISCRDTIDPREAKPPSAVQQQEASGPVTVLRLTCTLSFPDGQKGEVSCGESGAGKKGVSQSVILPWYSAYAVWLPFNLVKDTTTETWTFIASVKNLLGQPIGTLDGTTAVGTKVFITYGPVASQGSGEVSITNADGTGNFTAPDQKYFNYPWITQPQATSPYREWKTHVPNTVTEVTMGVSISTDFPAEQSVASTPPDTVPTWIDADSSAIGPTDSIGFRFTKNVVRVIFREGATLDERQLAVALVGGKVVGGERAVRGDGIYYLKIDDDGSGTQLRNAIERLSALPQVQLSSAIIRLSEMYLRPNDGTGDWEAHKWRLSPGNADLNHQRWALEEVEAPMAWGCSTGSLITTIGVVDHGFDTTRVPDLKHNLPSSSYALNPLDTGQHATHVVSVLAAEGNNNRGLTGMMWRASLDIEDPRIDPANPSGPLLDFTDRAVASRLSRLVNRGVPVINLSIGMPFVQKDGKTTRKPGTWKRDSTDVLSVANVLSYALSHNTTKPLPLLVIAAGNFTYAGANGTINSWWSALPILRDSFPDNVIVVGASTKNRTVPNFSGNNVAEPNRTLHQYVEVMAPGEDVSVFDRQGNVVTKSGTSLAAPMVTGMAGLLLSFDPQLSLSPSELKHLILAGADSSWDAAGANDPARHVTGNGGPYRLLNAYEALKLAAHRPNAPLCGNHVWIAGHTVGSTDFDTVVVQRGSSVTERIWGNDPEGTIAILNVQHGGHRISYHGATEYRAIEFNPLTRNWQAALPDDSLPVVSDGGTYNSYRWTSHDGDSSLVYSTATQSTPTVTIRLYDSHAGTTNPLATVPTLLTPAIWTDSVCVRLAREENKCQGYGPIGAKQEANVLAAYSPMGDTAIVSVARTQFSSIGISEWAVCDTVVIHNPDSTTSVNHIDCRGVQYWKNSVDTKLYKLPINAVTNNPTASWTMDSVRATQLAVTEDGSELAAGYGTIDVLGDAQGFTNCRITYRNLRTGQESPPIPSEPACVFFGAVTASPLRRPSITLQARE